MIDEALVAIKNGLNAYLTRGQDPEESVEDLVVFLDGANMEPLSFKMGAISVLLINIEEENALRSADPYRRSSSNGSAQKTNPEIRLNLYILFVAHFSKYVESLRYLSNVIRYFQSYRIINHQNSPALSENIDQLIMELATLPFSEQNEIWNALRVTYHPSVLFKAKMVIFQDEDSQAVTEISEKIIHTGL